MSTHPIILFVRFLLETAALISVGLWGWEQGCGWSKYLLAALIPLILAAIWGIFAVPDDPSRSGKAPIKTPGIIRIIIEFGIFGFALWALFDTGYNTLSLVLGIIVIIHYLTSYDRLVWLVRN